MEVYDYIIVGAGSAGCVLADRLSRVGDFVSKELLLAWLLALASVSLVAISFLPLAGNMAAIIGIVLVIGYLTYAIKGLYWALLDHCPVPRHLIGLAIGLVSFFGYMPDVLLPLYDGFLSRHYPRAESFKIYFTSIALCGFLGAALCLVFWQRSRRTAIQPLPLPVQENV